VTKTGFSYGRQSRLTKRREFLDVYAKGEKVRTRYFYLYRMENRLGRSRLGLTVSRKIGKTNLRNKLKRRLREIFRKNCADSPHSYDLVVNVVRTAASAPYKSLEEEFIRALGGYRWS